jgi:hypothetical protein
VGVREVVELHECSVYCKRLSLPDMIYPFKLPRPKPQPLDTRDLDQKGPSGIGSQILSPAMRKCHTIKTFEYLNSIVFQLIRRIQVLTKLTNKSLAYTLSDLILPLHSLLLSPLVSISDILHLRSP